MPAQALLPLPSLGTHDPEPTEIQRRAERVREVVGMASKRVGPKRVARAAGRGEDNGDKTLHAAVREADRNKLGPADIVAAITLDDHHDIIRALCAIAGGTFVPTAHLTDEQRLANWRRALREVLATDVAIEIIEDAGEDLGKLKRKAARYLSPRTLASLEESAEGTR